MIQEEKKNREQEEESQEEEEYYTSEYDSEDEWLHSGEINRINRTRYELTPLKSKFKVNGKEIQVTIDTGATTSVIMDKLRRKLKLKIQKPSKEIFRIANGKLITLLGELEVRVEFEGEEVLIKTQVIESREEVLLIGIECLDKLK